MTVYVLQWRNYLDDFQASDFVEEEDAWIKIAELGDNDDPTISVRLVQDEMSLRSGRQAFSNMLRRDLYELMDGHVQPKEHISSERLFQRLESWMRESA